MACIVEGAARVFRREGPSATTNRIAAAAGVSIGTLYEYFPHKQALLAALAERHLEEAERGIALALALEDDGALLAALQAVVRASQRYPSQALALLEQGARAAALKARAERLEARVLAALAARASAAHGECPEAAARRARAVFAVVCELTSRAQFDPALSPDDEAALSRHWLAMGRALLRA